MNLAGLTPEEIAAGARRERLLLRGRALRFVLVNELARHRTLTVAEMVTIVRRYRFDLGGRESKIISDALRWELARGRVVKVARGVYRYGKIPCSTARRIRIFAAVAIRWMQVVAPTRTTTPIGLHPQPPGWPTGHQYHIDWPPWRSFNWLWQT